ncbi:MAG TPA: ATP-binding cassette domain-containing protein, partial [Spirochaetia bacterium]|nr:ATP-binding cassette domain-containing protein [Spirochaetia bacterium]
MPIIDIRDVSVSFADGTVALSHVNLSVERGEVLIIAGRNGSGKTVLMRCITGLVIPTGGAVFFDGKPVSGNLKDVRRRVGLVFQNSENQ